MGRQRRGPECHCPMRSRLLQPFRGDCVRNPERVAGIPEWPGLHRKRRTCHQQCSSWCLPWRMRDQRTGCHAWPDGTCCPHGTRWHPWGRGAKRQGWQWEHGQSGGSSSGPGRETAFPWIVSPQRFFGKHLERRRPHSDVDGKCHHQKCWTNHRRIGHLCLSAETPCFGGWDHTPPYTLDAHKVLKWVTDTVQAPAGLGSAFARNYVSFNHSLGGTSGFPEHDAAKFIVVLGWAQKDAHRRRETDSVLQGMQQSLRNLATDLYNAAHACPHLFLAALKSGSHPTKCGLCVPVFGFRLGGGFSNFDKLRSKDVLVPESKAFVSYLQEMLKICDRNKASALLATEMDIGHLRSIVKEELRRGWLGHSKVMSWKDTAIGDVLWGDGGNCTWGGALHVFIDIFIDNVFVDDVQPLSVSALYVFGVSVIVPGFDVVA